MFDFSYFPLHLVFLLTYVTFIFVEEFLLMKRHSFMGKKEKLSVGVPALDFDGIE